MHRPVKWQRSRGQSKQTASPTIRSRLVILVFSMARLALSLTALGNIYIADTANCIVRKRTGTGITTIAGFEPTIVNADNPFRRSPHCGSTHMAPLRLAPVRLRHRASLSTPRATCSSLIPRTTWSGKFLRQRRQSRRQHTSMLSRALQPCGSSVATVRLPQRAKLNNPMGIYIDIYDNLFIADAGNHRSAKCPQSTAAR